MFVTKAVAILFFLFFGFLSAISTADTQERKFPFGGKINWDKEEHSKNYEKIFQKYGISKEFYRKIKNEIAAAGECFLLKDAGGIVGEVAVFSEFFVSGVAENAKTGDKKKIDIKMVEVVSDKDGGLILLTTHRFRLNAFEEFMAGFRKKKPYGERAPYYGPDLGDGYRLDDKTQELANKLFDAAKRCGDN